MCICGQGTNNKGEDVAAGLGDLQEDTLFPPAGFLIECQGRHDTIHGGIFFGRQLVGA